jgi:hypothetical protein
VLVSHKYSREGAGFRSTSTGHRPGDLEDERATRAPGPGIEGHRSELSGRDRELWRSVFEQYAGLYVLHFHDLEHEDAGMMLNLDVS